MKKSFVLLLLCISILLSGCDLWMDGYYYNVQPHLEDDVRQDQGSIEAGSYADLKAAVIELVEDCGQKAVIYFKTLTQAQLRTYMENVIRDVKYSNPIGAYAVDEITYEIGTTGGMPAVAVEVTYLHSRSEILRIKQVKNMDTAIQLIAAAVEDCDAGVVLKVEQYEAVDIAQRIQDYVEENPDDCMETPQVSAVTYPESGFQRVVEITFTYQTSREVLRDMQNYVGPVFSASDLNVRGEEEESVKFSRIYSFLMERSDYQLETSITPAYSLLRHGVGDSKAFANVYAAMCRRAGLECQTVAGTREGEAWFWNLICEDGIYYYVDLLQSNSLGKMQRLTEEDMQGYVWDYTAYPPAGAPEPEPTETTAPGA